METNATVSVLVVDDRGPFRAAARAVIDLTDGFSYAGEAENGEAAIAAAQALRPALVLMDINLPGMNGCDAAECIIDLLPGTVVFLMSTYASGDLPSNTRTCGAATFIRKERFGPELLEQLWRDHAPPRAA